MVWLFLGEGESEVLDAVDFAEAFKEIDELAEFFGKPIVTLVRVDASE